MSGSWRHLATLTRPNRPGESAAVEGEGSVAARLRIGPSPWPALLGVTVFVAAVLSIFFGGSQYVLYEATLIVTYGIVTVAQDWIFGRTGLVSLGPAAIMAVGAFTAARLSTEGWAVFPIPVLIAFVFGGIVGLLIGIPGLRFRGLYLMLTTLALQFIISFAAQKYQGVNREAGFTVIPPHWGSLLLSDPKPLFIVNVVVLAVLLLTLAGMYRGVPGRAWSALRQNEAAASVLGVNLVRWKLMAFVGSSAVTAVGGALYAYQIGQVQYTTYSLDLSLTLVVMVFIGGVGTMTGPILGAVAIVLLPVGLQKLSGQFSGWPTAANWLSFHEALVANAIYGLALLLILIFERDGVFGLLKRLVRLGLRLVQLVAGLTRRRAVDA